MPDTQYLYDASKTDHIGSRPSTNYEGYIMYTTIWFSVGIIVGALCSILMVYWLRGCPMFTMTLNESGKRTGLVERPLVVSSEEEAIVLAEEAVKRYIGKDDIVIVPAPGGDYYVVEITPTVFTLHLKEL